MTFRTLHTATFATIPLLGILALHTASALPNAGTSAALLVLTAALLTPEDARARVPTAVTSALPLALAAVAALTIARGAEPVFVAVQFSVALQLIRVATRSGATHDPQIVILAILHIVAAAVLGGSIAFGACLAAFVLVAPAALTLSHLRREVERNYEAGAKDRAGRRVDVERILRSKRVVEPHWVPRSLVIAPFVLAFTALLFLIVPRVGLAMFLLAPRAGTRMIGFSDRVDLGAMGALTANEALAARVDWHPPSGEPAPGTLPFALRGTAFDAYDGKAWSRTDSSPGPAFDLTRDPLVFSLGPRDGNESTLRIRLEPLEPTVIFLPNGARTVTFHASPEARRDLVVHDGPEGEWRYEAPQPMPLDYEVATSRDQTNVPAALSPDDRQRYLALPVGLDARISELANAVTRGEESSRGKAARLAKHLRENYRYTTTAPSGGHADPLAHFLFETKAGHCEFFSTALAIMLRTQGIPTRNVTGFVGAQRNAFGGYYSVRQQNAHAWVELWTPLAPHAGRWEALDATPVGARDVDRSARMRLQEFYEALSARWDRHVAAFDLADQAHLAERVLRPADRLTASLKRVLHKPALWALLLLPFLLWALRKRAGKDGTPLAGEGSARSAAATRSLVHAIEHALARYGTRGPHETPRAFVDRVAPANLRPTFDRALTTYEELRFGETPPDPDRVSAMIHALKELRAEARAAT